ncbi:hypothetical protein RB195_001530 [Necator americanus]|uniref:Reverse transcriptase domain-containing protein n=1 Tax=Necator americanus TaxID=51031 RepID=A0ABR1DER6_NECAM
MSDAEQITAVAEFPMCTELFCADYFTPLQILLLILMFGRFILAVIILLLGLRMEKDFMRSITVAIFIPMMFCEFFNIYCEVVAYINLFSLSEEQYNFIYIYFLEWTHSFLYVIYDYVHYNIVIQLILLLYCCRLAYLKEERINAFPLNTICFAVQIIPFFLSVLYYVSDGTTDTTLRILSIASRIVMITCFIVISVQIFTSFLLLCRVLPYTHSNSTDMQLRDARSRLAWTLVYLILPYIALIPFLVDAFAWLVAFSGQPGIRTMQVQAIRRYLSTNLWLPIPENLEVSLCRILCYADDVVIFAESSTKLQHVVNVVSKLAAACELRLRSDKCKQMWISSRPRTGIKVNGQPIELVNEFCYLGCTLRKNSSYERDVQQRCAKVTSAFNSLTKCLWSVPVTNEVKLRVYLSATPIMMYGS